MKRTAILIFLCLLVLTSCAPTTEKVAEFDSSVIQSVDTLRRGDEITFTWEISGELPTYATWIEFYHENVVSFRISPRQYVYEGTALHSEEMFFTDTFRLREVAGFRREGTKEVYTLLFYVALQQPGGRTVRSELNQITFFTINNTDDEK